MEFRLEEKGDDLSLYMDEEFWRKVHKPLFFKRLKMLRAANSIEELEEVFEALEKKVAFSSACGSLKIRQLHSEELKGKLKLKKITPATIEYIIRKCAEYGYLNDEAFVSSYIRSQIAKGIGPNLLKMKLKKKCKMTSENEEEMKIQYSEKQGMQIEKLILKKFKTLNIDDWKLKQKAFQFLMRKGFEVEIIKEKLGNNS